MKRTTLIAALIALTALPMPTLAETREDTSDMPLLSFESPDEARAWFTVNDNVMGGRSLGGSGRVDDVLLFAGSTNTNGGGFSSIRRRFPGEAIGEASGFTIRVRSDNRTYRMMAQTDATFYGRRISYQAVLNTSGTGEWETVQVPFDAFIPSFRGRRVPAGPLEPSKVNQIGLIINDGLDGHFKLEVESIGIADATKSTSPES